MGLDNLWIAPDGKTLKPVTFDPPLQLIVGCLTDPATSFRGKCYADLISAATGICIYDDLSNSTVLKTADKLDRAILTLSDLARMFRQFGMAGYDLVAWY